MRYFVFVMFIMELPVEGFVINGTKKNSFKGRLGVHPKIRDHDIIYL